MLFLSPALFGFEALLCNYNGFLSISVEWKVPVC